MSGIIGSAINEDFALSTTTKIPSAERRLEIMLEAARRATWDAVHGPKHLRSGLYRPSDALRQDANVSPPGDSADSAAQQ